MIILGTGHHFSRKISLCPHGKTYVFLKRNISVLEALDFFGNPTSVALDPSNKDSLIVADMLHHSFVIFLPISSLGFNVQIDIKSGKVSIVAGNGTPSFKDGQGTNAGSSIFPKTFKISLQCLLVYSHR
mmetsp:Transcript_18632/g.27879  ORF Transcript_18632/g.27879 Transcript_18632/m.27879 type:complete len:129 (+) Transcript_18632:235-621(+)